MDQKLADKAWTELFRLSQIAGPNMPERFGFAAFWADDPEKVTPYGMLKHVTVNVRGKPYEILFTDGHIAITEVGIVGWCKPIEGLPTGQKGMVIWSSVQHLNFPEGVEAKLVRRIQPEPYPARPDPTPHY